MKILLLEDSIQQAERIVQLLKRLGYECAWVNRSSDALAFLEFVCSETPERFPFYLPDSTMAVIEWRDDATYDNNKLTDWRVDDMICLFDIQLDREQTTGIEVGKRFRTEGVPVMFLTQYSHNAITVNQVKAAGFDENLILDKRLIESDGQALFAEKLQMVHEATFETHLSSLTMRKIAFYTPRKEDNTTVQIRTFFSENEIVCLFTNETSTDIVTTNPKHPIVSVARNLGNVLTQISVACPNIVKLGNDFAVNLNKIVSVEGNYLSVHGYGRGVSLTRAGMSDLKRYVRFVKTTH